MKLYDLLLADPCVAELLRSESSKASDTSVFLPDDLWAPFALSLLKKFGKHVVVLVPEIDEFLEKIALWNNSGIPVKVYDEDTIFPAGGNSATNLVSQRRIEALRSLCFDTDPFVLVTSRKALAGKVLNKAIFVSYTLRLSKSSHVDFGELIDRLVNSGYQRSDIVEHPGEFAQRGGIIDVFPVGQGYPVRFEFFGNQLESIWLVDTESQRSVVEVDEVIIPVASEVLNIGVKQAVLSELKASCVELADYAKQRFLNDISDLEAGQQISSTKDYAAYLEDLGDFTEYIDGAIVLDCDPEIQRLNAANFFKDIDTTLLELRGLNEFPKTFRLPYEDLASLDLKIKKLNPTVVSAAGSQKLSYWQPAPSIAGRTQEFRNKLIELKRQFSSILIVTEQASRVKALLESDSFLPLLEINPDICVDLDSGVYISTGRCGIGAALYPTFCMLGDYSLFGTIPKRINRSRGQRRDKSNWQVELRPGDLVVHIDHGIGRFLGMRIIESSGQAKEYLEIEYAEGDKVYVPSELLNRVQKYIGADGEVKLDRLGSGEWSRAKARAKQKAESVAKELLEIYAKRQARRGHAFPPRTEFEAELEASFPYEETPDQVRAMREIEEDMQSDRPMDRLICGDVGFGKTELAVRAAFKAVLDGKQVAVLVPTTVLAQQHLLTFKQRLARFGVNVAMLSRAVAASEQKKILADMKLGLIDVIIGTHRLLQSDVKFKDLGLLIIDEEHRFGVLQKERLKAMKSEVDVLTLSATPIPRTLHMALSGIWDISVVTTPPQERHPVSTFVAPYNDELIQRCMRRELVRGGQVYYVHNRIATIYRAADKIAKLIPEARIGIGHGRMDEAELANVMTKFVNHEFDVLVCTSIVESGLDIPNANTIIVDNCDKFGLAQLYQLRGRVGRSARHAYCYFLYDSKSRLSDQAVKRLKAISQLTELGAGFTLAMQDLEIRGAGNLLGTEQHGVISAVGYELFIQLLREAVEQLKAGKQVSSFLDKSGPRIDLPFEYYIPNWYVESENLRLDIYRDLASVESERELNVKARMLRERFGPLPQEVSNLIFALCVKIIAMQCGIESVRYDGKVLEVKVDAKRFLDLQALKVKYPDVRILPNRLVLQISYQKWQAMVENFIRVLSQLYNESAALIEVEASTIS